MFAIIDILLVCRSILYLEGNLETKVFSDPVTGLVRRIREVAIRQTGMLFLQSSFDFEIPPCLANLYRAQTLQANSAKHYHYLYHFFTFFVMVNYINLNTYTYNHTYVLWGLNSRYLITKRTAVSSRLCLPYNSAYNWLQSPDIQSFCKGELSFAW